MTNRLNELTNELPKSKKAIDELVNCIASYENINDNTLYIKLKELEKKIRCEYG